MAVPSIHWAQFCADVLTLLVTATCTGSHKLHGIIALAGGLAAIVVIASLPQVLLFGSTGALCIVCTLLHAAAISVRVLALHDETRALDRPRDYPLSAAAANFLFWPEVLLRTSTTSTVVASQGRNELPQAIEVWRAKATTPAATLCICGVPTLALVRRAAREQGSVGPLAQPTATSFMNLSAHWDGHATVYEELGLSHAHFRAGSTDVTELVGALKRLLLAKREVALRVVMHCETGELGDQLSVTSFGRTIWYSKTAGQVTVRNRGVREKY